MRTIKHRPPLQRMAFIWAAIREHRLPNMRSLAGELEISTKAIQRDMDFMRERLGFAFRYDRQLLAFLPSGPLKCKCPFCGHPEEGGANE